MRVALLQHYRTTSGSQAQAAEALKLPQNVVSRNTSVLIEAGVVVGNPPGRGRMPGRYVVDEARLRELAAELMAYSLGESRLREFAQQLLDQRH